VTIRDVNAECDDAVAALDRLVAAAGALRQDLVDGALNEKVTASAIRDVIRANDALSRALTSYSKTRG
jgi:hypothetical protein